MRADVAQGEDVLSPIEVSNLLGVSPRTVKRHCKSGAFKTKTVIDNGGPQYRVHLTSLPEPAQVKYWLQRMGETFRPDTPPDALRQWALSLQLEPGVHQLLLNKAGLNVPGPDPLAWSPEESTSRHEAFIRLPTFAQAEARRKAQLLRGFALAKRKAPTGAEGAAEDAYAKAEGVGLSTLRKWFKEGRNLNQQDWEPALVPGWHGGKLRTEIEPVLKAYIEGLYLVQSKPTLRSAYRKAERFAAERGLAMPSYEVVKARIKELPRLAVLLMREGKTALDQALPGVIRDWSTVELHEVWNSDGRKADVMVRFPDGEVTRPVLMAMIDMKTRYPLGLAMAKGENVALVRQAFANAVTHAGGCLPQRLYLDNGSAYAAKSISGGQAKRNRFKVKDDEIDGILTKLGVQVQWAIPGRGQSKPIESMWNSVANEVDKHFPDAYCGRNTVERPEGNDPKKRPITSEQYWAAVQEWFTHYIRRPHRGIGMDGEKTPLQAYTELLPHSKARVATASQLELMLLVPQAVKLNKRDRSFVINGNVYWHEALAGMASTGPYEALYDATDARVPVRVYDGEEYICAADLRLRTGAQNLESATAVNRAKKRAMRAVKDVRDALKAEQKALLWDKEKPPAAPGAAPLPAPKVAELVQPSKNYKSGKKVANGYIDTGVNPYITPEMEANRARKIAAMGGRF